MMNIVVHSRQAYNKVVMNLLLILSFITTIFSIIAIGYFVVENSLTFIEFMQETGYVMWLTFGIFFGPLVLALFLSLRGHSFWLMIRGFVPYILFIHMLISWFGSYSFSRLWDMSWGNRPAGEMSSEERDAVEKRKKRYKVYNGILITGIFLLNIVVFLIPRYIQLLILCVFFSAGIIQMFLSIVYMFIQIPSKMLYLKKKYIKFNEEETFTDDDESIDSFDIKLTIKNDIEEGI